MSTRIAPLLALAACVTSLFGITTGPAFARQVVISEVMSSNSAALADEDGDFPDWIELRNGGTAPVDVAGWRLSDRGDPAAGWVLPSRVLAPGEHLVVFASDKDRQGLSGTWTTPIARGHIWRYRLGSISTPTDWMRVGFIDGGWATGASGIGYGDGDDATTVQAAISVAARTTFQVADPSAVVGLALHVDYDDGFIAYLNGQEIARANLGTPGTPVSWAMVASRDREAAMYQGGRPDEFLLTAALPLLVAGANTLAIEVHNVGSGSSDLSLIPFLSIATAGTTNTTGVAAEIAPLFQRFLHSNFRIAVGETLCLATPAGDTADCFVVPAAPTDYSTGRTETGAYVIYTTPTPGAPNVTATYSGQAPMPLVSHAAGHQASGFTLTITSDLPGATVVVTTDGGLPNTAPGVGTWTRTITATTAVRARVVAPGMMPGVVDTRTFLVESTRSMPVVSLTTHPSNLWDWTTGIYVLGPNAQSNAPNFGANFWQEWEKPVHIEWFEPGGVLAFSHGAGVQVYGGWSRAHPQKSLALYARAEYGKGTFEHRLFESKPFDRFETFVLRNSGNDWNRTQMRDGYMQSLIQDTEIDWMAYRPAVVYLNGEYWGIQNIREKINEHFVALNGGIDGDNIDLMDAQGDFQYVAIRGDATAWNELMDHVRNADVGSPGWLDGVARYVDLDNYIDYHIAQIFFDNTDWPGNNVKIWRERSDAGRFRWILYDTDFGFGLYSPQNYHNNSLAAAIAPNGPNWPNPPWSTYLLRRLMVNGGFRRLFVNRYADFLNTRFRTEHMLVVLDSLATRIAPEIPRHTNRWGRDADLWNQDLEVMRQFARLRPAAMTGFLRSYLVLGATNTVSVHNREPWGGRIRVNRESVTGNAWQGQYFVGVPVPVTAVPLPGYRFTGWTGRVTSNDLTVLVDAGDKPDLVASFAVDPGAESSIVLNEIMYHPPDVPDSGDWVELHNLASSPIDLSGWSLTDGDPTHVFTLPAGSMIEAGGYLVLAQGLPAFTGAHPTVAPVLGGWGWGFSKSGETLFLLDGGGAPADSVAYTDEAPWPVEADGAGSTLELVEPTGDNRLPNLWQASIAFGGSPGARNAIPTAVEAPPIGAGRASIVAYPNPFAGQTTLELNVPQAGDVHVVVFDVLGRQVDRFELGTVAAGAARVRFDRTGSAAGLLLFRLYVNDRAVASGSAALIR